MDVQKLIIYNLLDFARGVWYTLSVRKEREKNGLDRIEYFLLFMR